MKQLRKRIVRGVSRSPAIWLTLLLLLVVVVPTLSLLWLVTEALESERLAGRQRLLDAYRAHLGSVQRHLSQEWAHYAQEVQRHLVTRSGSAAFAGVVQTELAQSMVLFDQDGAVAYPDYAYAAAPRGLHPEMTAIESIEATQPRRAAENYVRVASSTESADLASQAFRGAIRSYARAGEIDQAIRVARLSLEEQRIKALRDANGRLARAGIALLALELIEQQSPPGHENVGSFLDSLEQIASNYAEVSMPSSQRRFLLRELMKRRPSSSAERLLQAEDLAADWLETRTEERVRSGFGRLNERGLVVYGSADARWATLHRSVDLAQRIAEMASALQSPAGVQFKALPPGATVEESIATITVGDLLPGWQIGLFPVEGAVWDENALGRTKVYGAIVAVSVILLLGLALLTMRLVRQQLALSQLRTDLVANVTHELKTPLASMRLLVDTLLEAPTHNEQTTREYLQLIGRENLRLSRLIDNFLTFSRIEKNKYVFNFENCAPGALVAAASSAVSERFRAAGCQFFIQVASDLPSIRGDADALVTSLVNLLENAFKYSGDDKRIQLSATHSGAEVTFSVQDNGFGIAEKDQKRVFRRFFQVGSRQNNLGEGCGLGLSIVDFVVTAHNGRIELQSEVGKGSTFSFVLPTAS